MRLLIVFIALAFGASSQVGTGQWRLHIPAKAVDVVATENSVFTAYEQGLSEYDKASGELSFWDAVNSLSDISISCLGNCTSDNSVFIGYENGNIDKIKNNTVTNIPAIKLAQIQGVKEVYKMVEYDEHMYLATGFAIVKIDPKKNEVRDTYYPTNGNAPIRDLIFTNDSIYALSDDRMYRGLISNASLADPSQWDLVTRVPIIPTTTTNIYTDIEYTNNEIYVLYSSSLFGLDSVYHLSNSAFELAVNETAFVTEILSLNTIDGDLSVNYYGGARIYNYDFTNWLSTSSYSEGNFPIPRNLSSYDGTIWIADQNNGLVKFTGPFQTEVISFSGPPKSDFYGMGYSNGKMAFTSGGQSAQSQPTFNKSGIYTFEDEEWTLHSRTTIPEWDNDLVFDPISVAIDPSDNAIMAVGGYSNTPLSVINTTAGTVDTISPVNSPLEASVFGNGWSYISEVEYDDEGNLWVLNGLSNDPLKVLTSDNEWYSFSLGSGAKSKFTDKMVIDYNGNKWMAIRGSGLFGYNDQGTISTASDDQIVNLTTGENTGALPSNEISALAVDFDNEIWIGTEAGFAVLYNSDGAFDAVDGDYNAQRIKIEFEGNVEYVLGSTGITDIEVDGANRKWFGTANAGILLLSADGLDILEHHTMENSPLISDNIQDLEINQETGELFIITDKGLISYRTNATYEDPDYADVQIFPNPVRPDFDGPITMQGIRYNSDVKITDVAGNLVYQTTSNGGTATWSGRTLTGEKVKSGIYLIWTAANEGKGRQVGKIAIVN
jgi:hypothetical protein